ncbi:MAG TPA: MraY family glycosyltransferase [Candidatus Dormibacteraeota bacterium]|nr:MraY family glycosyltransferase [Candidatus Dormibacteraeota bacterium]
MLASTTPWLPALPPFLLASVLCMAAVPITMVVARRIGRGAVDDPEDERRIHKEPTPRLGGLAMYVGFAAAVAAFGGSISARWQIVAISGVVTIAMAVDDILGLPWYAKLIVETGGGLLAYAVGVAITFIALPGGDSASVLSLGLMALPITLIWFVGLQNSINFLDGVDGVAAGVVAIVAGVLLLAAINRLGPTENVQSDVIVLSGALMGCCIGFLVFNFSPARTFMGDSGSHFLGVALGMLTVLGVAKLAVALSLLVPLVALGLPIGDTAFAIVRRRRAGRGIAYADTGHLHHRLLDLGFSARETALSFYLATAILGCIGLALFGHRRILLVAVGLLALALAGMVWRNLRRPPGSGGVPAEEPGYVTLPGRPATPTRVRHGGEVD